jgi:hypothetical protein
MAQSCVPLHTYAFGGGYVQRVHGYSLAYFANQVIRSLGGAVVSLLKADLENCRIYLLRAAGQIRGYFWGPRDISKVERMPSKERERSYQWVSSGCGWQASSHTSFAGRWGKRFLTTVHLTCAYASSVTFLSPIGRDLR